MIKGADASDLDFTKPKHITSSPLKFRSQEKGSHQSVILEKNYESF